MFIDLNEFETLEILKNTTGGNVEKFLKDIKNYNLIFCEVMEKIQDHDNYFNTLTDVRDGIKSGLIYFINVLEFKDPEEFKDIINNYYAAPVNDEVYLIIE